MKKKADLETELWNVEFLVYISFIFCHFLGGLDLIPLWVQVPWEGLISLGIKFLFMNARQTLESET